MTGAGGSKLSLIGFVGITCSIGKFTFTEEFAVIDRMVSDMLLGIKWEHKFNIHTGWTRHGNHYISRGKHNFIAESMNRLKTHPIIKTKGKVELDPESIALVEIQAVKNLESFSFNHFYLNFRMSVRTQSMLCIYLFYFICHSSMQIETETGDTAPGIRTTTHNENFITCSSRQCTLSPLLTNLQCWFYSEIFSTVVAYSYFTWHVEFGVHGNKVVIYVALRDPPDEPGGSKTGKF